MNTQLMRDIHARITAKPEELDMGHWHPPSGCGSARCIAGWAAHSVGKTGNTIIGRELLEISQGVADRLFFCQDDEAADALRLLIENPDLPQEVLADKLADITTVDTVHLALGV